eukprot:CAMPEP_0118934604 /NCGR_PEP_ID=MMETSP1169-20130426/13916_1 /TAXON_ID=36882 /ORGANISM="Pyramimonas obovata, Strain CCMP722" /LENGTH=242 /DNA_ID=CAMNT_0006877525 /DNA_START=118 /DNA_END=846 /DNA_ORIENTATION=-
MAATSNLVFRCQAAQATGAATRARSLGLTGKRGLRANVVPVARTARSFGTSKARDVGSTGAVCVRRKRVHGVGAPTELRTRGRAHVCHSFRFEGGGGGGGGNNNITSAIVTALIIYLLAGTPVGRFLLDGWLFLWALAFILPPVLLFAFNLYTKKNVVSSQCPNCAYPMDVLKNADAIVCPSCGTNLELDGDQLLRKGPSFERQQENPFGTPFGNGGFSSKASNDVIDAEVIDVDVVDKDKK